MRSEHHGTPRSTVTGRMGQKWRRRDDVPRVHLWRGVGKTVLSCWAVALMAVLLADRTPTVVWVVLCTGIALAIAFAAILAVVSICERRAATRRDLELLAPGLVTLKQWWPWWTVAAIWALAGGIVFFTGSMTAGALIDARYPRGAVPKAIDDAVIPAMCVYFAVVTVVAGIHIGVIRPLLLNRSKRRRF